MQVSNLFNRYVWLVDLIYRSGHITLKEINSKWLDSSLNNSGEEIPKRTFHNHRKAIETMFDINIECSRNQYYIGNADDMKRGGVRSWLLNTFAVNNLINESHKLKSRILFEKIPSGQRFLTPIIEAMRDGHNITLTYQNYWQSEPHTFEVSPYCIKVFRQRWYLVAWNEYNKDIRIYTLDRVQDMQTADKKFCLPDDFDGEEYFATCFGIINQGKAELVKLKVNKDENKHLYFQSLPLHPSQKLISETNDHAVFEYFLKPTYDFRQEILSHGYDVEVLCPESLRNEIATVVKTQAEAYK